jgi:glycosyltransferase involved in cell wall biosynthesis
MDTLVSVVVPVYNVEKYLDRCVQSILKQTYSDIEIILVDDGSTDNSGTMCEDWKKRDKRIIAIHKENGGLSDARNHGLKYATGDYICFIDSDDFVDYRFVEVLYSLIAETGTQIAAVGLKEYSEGDPIQEDAYFAESTKLVTRNEAIRYLLKNSEFQDYAWNKIYRRDLFGSIKYPVGRKMEDLGTTYKLFRSVDKIAYNPCRLYYYFQRDDSIIHAAGQKFYEDKYALARERYADLKSEDELQSDNAHFLFRAILDCYPHLKTDERKTAKREIQELWPVCRGICSSKNKVKYLLLSYLTQIYIRMYQHD